MSETVHYRKGFGLKASIQGELDRDYYSGLVAQFRNNGFRLDVGDLSLFLAREFGFCYGVDRAVEYAYETRMKFPDRSIHITGEIIHNPHVNQRLRDMGITYLSTSPDDDKDFASVDREDVVILPAFGVTVAELDKLREQGCILVDTTCGSVLNVWKNVERYAREGFTSVIHGKYSHEETRATASRATQQGSHYLVVQDMEEAEWVATFIEEGDSGEALMRKLPGAVSDGFEPDRDLQRIGLANQTTMLSSESLDIGRRLERAVARRYGEEGLASRFRAFDTICSATQDRQDAVRELIARPLERMLVIGGYNSSNTNHLAELAMQSVTTFHIEDAACILGPERIRHKPVGSREEVVAPDWLPDGPVRIGITAGASTPSNKIGEVVEQVVRCRGLDPAELVAKQEAGV
jgi:4-hydroxy-3-methylbut-2-en-1-yl diphosphate reductase